MITNAREYRITRAAAKRFEAALVDVDRASTDRHVLLQKALRESIESELGMLREQLAEYEALHDGKVRVLEVDSLDGLPDGLIRARVAAGLTQKALAERLGLKEQQIQRYEATHYAGVAFRRVTEVANALGVQVRERIELPPVTRRDEPSHTEPSGYHSTAEEAQAPQT